MTKMISYRPAAVDGFDAEAADGLMQELVDGAVAESTDKAELVPAQRTGAKPVTSVERLLRESPFFVPTGYATGHENRPVLAVFCYETPDSFIGKHVAHTVAALARRQQTSVHLFSRHRFATAPNVVAHVVGPSEEEELVDQVLDFASRACNAFLRDFPGGSTNLTLMGYEWTAVPVLSLLRGLKNVDFLLSLHSLERQRSDMTSEVSRQIEEIECEGLREARTLLLHEQATAEVARFWVPECAGRMVNARSIFPVEQFHRDLDPGEVKARYQVGPVDPTILCIGDLSERYGPDLLIKAMPAILKNQKQARLIVVGEGDLYWPLRVYARYLLLEHAIRLAGSVEGQPLFDLVRAADVIAVPSRETTPWWPILAGWAAGRPVVATHHAAPGLVENEQDGVLFYPNENSSVWGIERVLHDPEFGRTIVRKGSAKLEERFGWNTLAEQVETLVGVPQAK